MKMSLLPTCKCLSCRNSICVRLQVKANSTAKKMDRTGAVVQTFVSGSVPTMYLESIEVTCDADGPYRLDAADTGCQDRSFRVWCNASGDLTYDDPTNQVNFTSTRAPNDMQCTLVTCPFNLNLENGQRGPYGDTDGDVEAGQTGAVTCNSGFAFRDLDSGRTFAQCEEARNLNATCNATTCALELQGDSLAYGADAMCHRKACAALSRYKTTDQRELVTLKRNSSEITSLQPDSLTVGESITVECPPGYKISTSGEPANTGDSSKVLTCSEENCDFASKPECSRMSCGFFQLPTGFKAVRTGPLSETLTSPSTSKEMLFGDSLILSCIQTSYVLSSSSVQECASSFNVTCGESGLETNSAFSGSIFAATGLANSTSNETCVHPQDKITCATCYKFWGNNTESRFPSHPSYRPVGDCNAGHCDFPLAQDHHYRASDLNGGGTCVMETDSTTKPCLPVLCRPLLLPPNAHRIEYGGQYYGPNASGYYPDIMCSDELTIFCADGFVPENALAADVACSSTSFTMTCGGDGYYNGFQKCVPKQCVLNLGDRSFPVALNSTHVATCSPGYLAKYQVNSGGLAPTCQENCLMSLPQACDKVRPYLNGLEGQD